jgi:hypothetical protein
MPEPQRLLRKQRIALKDRTNIKTSSLVTFLNLFKDIKYNFFFFRVILLLFPQNNLFTRKIEERGETK